MIKYKIKYNFKYKIIIKNKIIREERRYATKSRQKKIKSNLANSTLVSFPRIVKSSSRGQINTADKFPP